MDVWVEGAWLWFGLLGFDFSLGGLAFCFRVVGGWMDRWRTSRGHRVRVGLGWVGLVLLLYFSHAI